MPRLMGVRWPDSWVYAVSTQRLDEGGRAEDGTRVYCEQLIIQGRRRTVFHATKPCFWTRTDNAGR